MRKDKEGEENRIRKGGLGRRGKGGREGKEISTRESEEG